MKQKDHIKKKIRKSQILDISVIVIITVVLLVVIILYRSTEIPTIQDKASKILNDLWRTQTATGTESLLFNKDKGFSFSDIIGTYFCYYNRTLNYSNKLKFDVFSNIARKMDYLFGKNKWRIVLYSTGGSYANSNNCFYFDNSGSMHNMINGVSVSVTDRLQSIVEQIDHNAKIKYIDSSSSCEYENHQKECQGDINSPNARCIYVSDFSENWLGEAMDVANNPSLCGWNENTKGKKNLFLASDELPGSCGYTWNGVSYSIYGKESYARLKDCMDYTINLLKKNNITVYYLMPNQYNCNQTEINELKKGAENITKRTNGLIIYTAEEIGKLKRDMEKYMNTKSANFLVISSNKFEILNSSEYNKEKNIKSMYGYKSTDFVLPLPCRTDEFIMGTLFYYYS